MYSLTFGAKPNRGAALGRGLRLVAFAILGMSLAACGGGGGGGGSSSPPPTQGPDPTPSPDPTPEPPPTLFESEVALGQSLFRDTNLSLNRSQSCSTCHDSDRAFTDGRRGADGLVGAASLGDDGFSLGDRNAPTGSYAHLTPEFGFGRRTRFNSQQSDYEGYIGGFFHDGRAATLADQAGGPPISAIEMGMPDMRAVVERIEENADYVATFEEFYGADIFDDDERAYAAMTQAIAAFESTDAFSSFDSKYDKSLRGEFVYDPLTKAARGRALFFSQQFTNCATCHQLRPNSSAREMFTGWEYHNIGVPSNAELRALNGIDADAIDPGLAANPAVPGVDQAGELGKYKTPTLRNIAVTGPYMHNGVFRELATVIMFYDQFFQGSAFPINPETGEAWREPPVPETLALDELLDGRRMTLDDVEAMVCFLRTLTDERYEPLIEENGVVCDT
ncbi:MAG: cytochrome c peroxidase [Pseudomonadota bacterium]